MLVVFALVAGVTLVAMGLAFLARADVRSAGSGRARAQARALAWSGVQAVMAELDAQRETILAGGEPRVVLDWSLYGEETERGQITLLPVGPGGERLVSESAKLDVNVTDAATLGKLEPLLTPELAQAIVAARKARPGGRFDSINDLLSVEGVTTELFWGSTADLRIQSTADANAEDDGGSAWNGSAFGLGASATDSSVGGQAASPRGLADALTVFSYEPVLQSNGVHRINVNAPFDERMKRRIERRFGLEFAHLVQEAKKDPDFKFDRARFYSTLADADFDAREPDMFLDAFTIDDQTHALGRVDLNRASPEVLAALPGLDADLAAALAGERATLSSEDRAGLCWTVSRSILTNEQWATVAPNLTWRSFAWRVRVLGRVLVGEGESTHVAAEAVYEVVIDLSSPRPRVAYLRDITLFETAVALSSAGASKEEADEEWDDTGDDATEGRSDEENDATGDESDGGSEYDGAGEPGADEDETSRGDNDAGEGETADPETDADEPSKTPPPVRPRGRWTAGGTP